MKKSTGMKAVGTIAGGTMLLGGALALGGLHAANPVSPDPSGEAAANPSNSGTLVSSAVDDFVKVANVQGLFTFSQDVTTPNDTIKNVFGIASSALCSKPGSATSADIADQTVTVSNGESSYSASVGDLAKSNSQKKIMGCACSGNLAGGGAIANAEVTGVSVQSIIAADGN
ncbi:MAG: hypothetical protein AB2L09_06710 [Coriobacteriia bacterium]